MTVKQILRECPVFSALSGAELDKIVGSVSEKQYEAGTTIFQEGDSAGALLVLQEGKVALQMTLPDEHPGMNRKITVDVVSKNEVIGWSALVEPYTYTLTAVCLQKVQALAVSGEELRELLRENTNIGYGVLKGLVKVMATRLDDTRQVLLSERLLLTKPG